MSKLRIGEVYRYARPYSPTAKVVDGLPNYFHEVFTPGHKLPLAESGINPVGAVNAVDGLRCPAIVISSSPHKIGAAETPWQDIFAVDHGFIRYFGDNKTVGKDPSVCSGNRALLEQFTVQTSPDMATRAGAVPILFFRRVPHGGRTKGNLMFQGLGVLERAERVTQHKHGRHEYFANYAFDCCVLSLAWENEEFDWGWISARRDARQSLSDSAQRAPRSWKRWIASGNSLVERVRRRLSTLSIVPTAAQRPPSASRDEVVLEVVYKFYHGRKSRFEALAGRVVQDLLRRQGTEYHEGWVTPPSGDNGADFVGRIDLGTGFASTRLVVLGQAKCEKLDAPTGGVHIARTVARLRRGWVGAYVTTSYYSASVQREVIEDQYPILLVNGLEVAQTVGRLTHEGGFASVRDYLESVDVAYEELVRARRPEEILLD